MPEHVKIKTWLHRSTVRGGMTRQKSPRNMGVQEREQKEKQTIYYYQHQRIWKPNYGSVIVYTEEAFYKFDENIRNYMMIQTDLHGLRGPMCKICFKPFASPQTLARHIEVQHIDSGVPYPCHYCEKIFKNKSHRSVHVHREHRAEHREYLDSKQQHNLTNLPPNWPSKTNTEIFHGHQNI